MKRPDYYTAFDPGEAHVGFATLWLHDGGTYEAEMGVLHRPSRSFSDLVNQAMPSGPNGTILVESYQQRAVGHQRFAAGETLQLIGAMRYRAECYGQTFATIMPGNARKDLDAMKLTPILDDWLPSPRPSRWEHAFSAWRVLGRFMLGHDTERLQNFIAPHGRWRMSAAKYSAYKKDLLSPLLHRGR